jgi:ABC-type transport system involved in cytochrome c biogenesis permease subunit
MKKIAGFLIALAVILGSLISLIQPVFSPTSFQKLSKIQVLQGGREKPLDSVARQALLILSSKQEFRYKKKKISSQEWIWDVMLRPQLADDYPVFRIDSPEILGVMGLEMGKEKYFSFKRLTPFFQTIQEQAEQADSVEAQTRTRLQRDMVQLRNKLVLYFQLKNAIQVENMPNFQSQALGFLHDAGDLSPLFNQEFAHKNSFTTEERIKMQSVLGVIKAYKFMADNAYFRLVPPSHNQSHQWLAAGEGLIVSLKDSQTRTFMTHVMQLSQSVHTKTLVTEDVPTPTTLEWLFNQWNPFYYALCLYVVLFLMVLMGWLFNKERLLSWAYSGLFGTFLIHTVAILIRMFIQGRPPVTNLYTSAIFVGWMAIVLGLIFERLYKNGIGSLVSSVIGFLTLIIAHHLAIQGDTLEMMQAVLDSNFWLSTHVVTVTMGYSATFLAGFLAHIYIVRGIFTKQLDTSTQQSLSKMTYATICFALFFSAVGTILGGIWADQSWGRFWGWDPKENGALLIVLWNAVILHARWAGLIRQRGLMACAVFGNIITSFSWFGVNMLGVGLHSYGFMDKAFVWLVLFVFTQLFVIWLGFLPQKYWKSRTEL